MSALSYATSMHELERGLDRIDSSSVTSNRPYRLPTAFKEKVWGRD